MCVLDILSYSSDIQEYYALQCNKKLVFHCNNGYLRKLLQCHAMNNLSHKKPGESIM